ncbi:MAG: ferritin-like domain-containing protein [Dehalogenimonas sp.]
MESENHRELLILLNRGLARELQVAIQYMIQHTLLTGKKESIVDVQPSELKRSTFIGKHSQMWLPGNSLKKIAVTEMRHAESIAERIVALEEKPTSQPDSVMIGDSPLEMMQIDRGAEESAIQLYTQIIDIAKKQGDEITVQLFQQILADEQSHLGMFNSVLR